MSNLIKDIFKKDSLSTIRPRFRNTERKVVVIDPLTLQPIRASQSLPSKGVFTKFSPKFKAHQKNRLRESYLLKLGECAPGKIRNSITGKCRTIKLKKTTKICPEGKILKNGRCVKTLENKLIADKARLDRLWLRQQMKLMKNINEAELNKKDLKQLNIVKKLNKNILFKFN